LHSSAVNKIILSFDYEIYFDGSNHLEALLENTYKILASARQNKSKLVFFIDVFYLIKLEENGLFLHFNKLKDQINNIIKDGHELQYHLHPHWINAQFNKENDHWKYDQLEYSLSDIIKIYGKSFAFDKFKLGVDRMKEWFNYEPLAYRAGGLSIDQNQEDLIELLIQNKFEFDSSVMPGLYLQGKFLNIDHRSAPKKEIWDIGDSFLNESKNPNSILKEVPIMTLNSNEIPLVNRIITSIKYRTLSALSAKDDSVIENIGNPFDLGINQSIHPNSITFDKSKSADTLLLKHFTKYFFKKNSNLMCILSHPKSFLNQSFDVFSVYLKWIDKNKNNYVLSGFSDIVSSEK
jgi:hypothetical protein